MPKSILGVFITLGLTAAVFAPQPAHATFDPVYDVQGFVHDETGKPVEGADVYIVCGGVEVELTRSDVDGSYHSNMDQCQVDWTIQVDVRAPGARLGSASSIGSPHMHLDVVVRANTSIPEYGWLGGLMAGGAGAGAIAYARRQCARP
ncbi:MAG TPA: hypothetical protein VMT30_05090 [Candidatus Saccharimonadia bacterium]|nr:hypothetical protein [Candidatus Saccharimonadia bacterium]